MPKNPAPAEQRIAPVRPKEAPYVSNMRTLSADPVRFLLEASRRIGSVVPIRSGERTVFVISHPDAVRRVLLDNVANYQKNFRGLQSAFGESVLMTGGERWRRLRQNAQPIFATQRLRSSVPTIVELAGSMLAGWRASDEGGRPVDVDREISVMSLRFGIAVLFAATLGTEAEIVRADLETMLVAAGRRAFALAGLGERVPQSDIVAFDEAVKRLRAFCGRLAESRRGGGGGDLLSLLLTARDDPAWPEMDDKLVCDEMLTYLFAGHDTVSAAISWTLHLLADHPDAQDRLRREVEAVIGDRPPTYDDLPRLPYLGMVVSEAMRLYPPVWMVSREVRDADELAGIPIAKDSTILVAFFSLHRNADLWERPDEFDPDRFSEARSAGRHPFAYLPFGAGPRICIGRRLALIEAPLVVARIVQSYRLIPLGERPVAYQAMISLRPQRGLTIGLESRSGAPAFEPG